MLSMSSFRVSVLVLGAVTIAACGGDPGRSSNSITGPTQTSAAVTSPAGGIQRTSAATSGADVQLSGSASTGSPDAGSALTYTFLVKNSGPDTADAVVLSDSLPAGTTYAAANVTTFSGVGGPIGCAASADATTVTCGVGPVAKGGQATFAITVLAPVTAGTFSNTAVVSSSTTDPSPANNSVTITAQVKVGLVGGACPLPPGQATLHGMVMWTGSTILGSGQQSIQNFAFQADNGTLYWVETNFYDGSAPLTSVINLDCKTSPVQFIVTGEFVTVTGTFGTDTVQLFAPTAGVPPAPTFIASVVQVPTHKDKI